MNQPHEKTTEGSPDEQKSKITFKAGKNLQCLGHKTEARVPGGE